jgi:copper chaperone CopZ
MCNCSTNTKAIPQATVAGARFRVADMTCGHCVATIRQALTAGMPGIDVSVYLAAHEVVVAGDARLAATIMREAGYEPMLLAGEPA